MCVVTILCVFSRGHWLVCRPAWISSDGVTPQSHCRLCSLRGGLVYLPVLTHSVCFLSIPSAAAVLSHHQHDIMASIVESMPL